MRQLVLKGKARLLLAAQVPPLAEMAAPVSICVIHAVADTERHGPELRSQPQIPRPLMALHCPVRGVEPAKAPGFIPQASLEALPDPFAALGFHFQFDLAQRRGRR